MKSPRVRRLEVFDFDGTLFRAPPPPPGKEEGWWSAPASLGPPNVPEAPGSEWWNPWELGRLKTALRTEGTKAVVLTGRGPVFAARLRQLLQSQGAEPHEAYLHPGVGGVLEWKLQVLKKLLTPWIRELHLYDDDVVNLTRMARSAEGSGKTRSVYPHLSTGSRTVIATKTRGEKEDEAAAALVRPTPKKKPPRKDLRKTRIDSEDPDLAKDDRDLSLNHKRVGGVSPPIAPPTVGDFMTIKKASAKGVRRLTASMDQVANAIESHYASLGIPQTVAKDLAARIDFVSAGIEKRAGFKPADIGKKVPGPLESDKDESFMKGNFTQEENTELGKLQTSGALAAAAKAAKSAAALAPASRRASVYARVRAAFLEGARVAEEPPVEEAPEASADDEEAEALLAEMMSEAEDCAPEASDDFGLFS